MRDIVVEIKENKSDSRIKLNCSSIHNRNGVSEWNKTVVLSTDFKFVSFKEMTLEIVPEEGAWRQEESRKRKEKKWNVGEDLLTQKTINQEEGKRVIQEG